MSQQFKIENSIIGMFKKILEYKNLQSQLQTGGSSGPPPAYDDVMPASAQGGLPYPMGMSETSEIKVEFNEIEEAYGIRTTEGRIQGLRGFDVAFSLQELIGMDNLTK
jgi:hypothetical protein